MSDSTIPQGAVCWACSDEAYKRIIAAVGEEPDDSYQLVSDLLNAYSESLRFRILDSDKGAKARKKLFRGIVATAIALRDKLLANKGYAARALFPEGLGELDRIIDEAQNFEKQNSSGAWGRHERPLHEWFAAEVLPKVFKDNFTSVHDLHPGEPVGFSRSRNQEADGPYIRFAVVVMGEMGMRIKPNTVASAIQDVRDGRTRRLARRPITQL